MTTDPTRIPKAKGLLLDYGGTLVEEASVDIRAGNEWLLAHASYRPPHLTLEHVLERSERVTREVADRRDVAQIETPWPMLTRLIHDALGVRFDMPMSELERGFWSAAIFTREMPGARAMLDHVHHLNLPIGVVSNTSFSSKVIGDELARHGLREHIAFVMVSADYAARKPNPLLFEVAAARLGVPAKDIWFVGDRLDTDVAGAKAAGMTAVWFNPDGRSDPDARADITISRWSELLTFLHKL